MAVQRKKRPVRLARGRHPSHQGPGLGHRTRTLVLRVPDTRRVQVRAALDRQCRALAASSHAAEDQAFVDAISLVDLGDDAAR